MQFIDAKVVEQQSLRTDNVTYGDEGKLWPIAPLRCRVKRLGSRGAVAGAEDIYADNAVVLCVEWTVRTKEVWPPVRNAGRARQRMAHQDYPVAVSLNIAVNRVMERDWLQSNATLQREWFGGGECEIRLHRRLNLRH